MDTEFTKWLVTLGVGGVLAGYMFAFYRKDIKNYTELWKMATDRLLDTLEKNTASNLKLITLIENIERNTLRKADIKYIINKGKMEQKDYDSD